MDDSLDYAAELIFLRKVGGGYMFVHQLLLDHFASLTPQIKVDEKPFNSSEIMQYHLEQAYICTGNNKLKTALQQCEMVIKLAPKSAEAHNLHSVILQRLGRQGEAIAAYEEAVRLDSSYREAKRNLMAAITELHKRKGASQELVTVHTFSHPIQAQIAQGLLEVNGIQSVIADESIVKTFGLFLNVMGGVKLLVRLTDVIRARRILSDF